MNDRVEGVNVSEVKLKQELLCFWRRHLDFYVFLLRNDVIRCRLRVDTSREFPAGGMRTTVACDM